MKPLSIKKMNNKKKEKICMGCGKTWITKPCCPFAESRNYDREKFANLKSPEEWRKKQIIKNEKKLKKLIKP